MNLKKILQKQEISKEQQQYEKEAIEDHNFRQLNENYDSSLTSLLTESKFDKRVEEIKKINRDLINLNKENIFHIDQIKNFGNKYLLCFGGKDKFKGFLNKEKTHSDFQNFKQNYGDKLYDENIFVLSRHNAFKFVRSFIGGRSLDVEQTKDYSYLIFYQVSENYYYLISQYEKTKDKIVLLKNRALTSIMSQSFSIVSFVILSLFFISKIGFIIFSLIFSFLCHFLFWLLIYSTHDRWLHKDESKWEKIRRNNKFLPDF